MSELAIVIPTLGRSQVLVQLCANIADTTPVGSCDVVLVVDDDDIDTLRVLEYMPNIRVLFGDGGYPGKANVGFNGTEAPFVLIAGDDVNFHHGWYNAGLSPFMDESICVVGPNDLSPATEGGENATMPIVRREYIDLHGGAWRSPGLVFHEGYHHNYTDTELWFLAKHRGVAHYAEDCVIEHMHPDWGKADEDETYKRGARTDFDKDAALFDARKAQWSVS